MKKIILLASAAAFVMLISCNKEKEKDEPTLDNKVLINEIFKAGMMGEKKGLLGTCIISVSNGYSCAYEAVAHFGLPKDKTVDIRLTMPCGGQIYEAPSVARNQHFILKK